MTDEEIRAMSEEARSRLGLRLFAATCEAARSGDSAEKNDRPVRASQDCGRLLTVNEAAALLAVGRRWLLDNYKRLLPRAVWKKLGRRTLRFSEPALQAYIQNGRRER